MGVAVGVTMVVGEAVRVVVAAAGPVVVLGPHRPPLEHPPLPRTKKRAMGGFTQAPFQTRKGGPPLRITR